MRDAFSEHFVGEPERQSQLWAECIFVLDTNVLLDLYRFSDSARDALFKVMESLGERLWIPYQVALEYFENRLNVIEAQSKAYGESIAGLKAAKEKFNSGARHPFVSDEVFNKFISSYDLMIRELEDKQKIYFSYIIDDQIKARVGNLFNGRVGKPYSEERLQEISIEGEKRYSESMPPGFQDGGKMPEATTSKLKLKKFGDLILWKQVIEEAVVADKSVILVTGEKKDDWWLKSNKGLVSALPALTKEFIDAVKKDFYLYATDRFLLKANEYLKQSTSAVVVEEVRAINKADADQVNSLEVELLDRALNLNWPKHAKSGSWVKGSDIKAWVNKSSKAPWYRDLSNSTLNVPVDSLKARRENIKERLHTLRHWLDVLRAERADLAECLDNLNDSSVSPDEEIYEANVERILMVEKIISEHEADINMLREEMRSLNAHLHGFWNGDAD